MNLDLLSPEAVSQLRGAIDGAHHIVIIAHARPDGDAIGSSLAWAEYISVVHQKDCSIVMPTAFPDFLRWMPGVERIVRYDKRPDDVARKMAEADLIFCLDFNSPSRTEDVEPLLRSATAQKVLIDHHLAPDIDAVIAVSHPEACSTAELVFRLVWQMGAFEQMGKKFATLVYCGMMTDTGGFTYNSTRPEIFFIICQLLTKRINKDKIYRNVFNNFSTWAIRLRGYLMSQKLNVFPDLHASYFTITRQDMADYHFVRGDAEGLVNEPLRIKGLRCSISLREDDRVDNRIWVSLRSVDDFSVEDMAKRFFNGGGHLNASGGRLDCSMEEAERITREAIKACADPLVK